MSPLGLHSTVSLHAKASPQMEKWGKTSEESFCWINASLHSHLWLWLCIWTVRNFTRMNCPWSTSLYFSKHLFPILKKPNRSVLLPRYWPTTQMQTQCEGAVHCPWQLQVSCSCPSALLWRDVQYLLGVSRKSFLVLLCGLSSWVLVTSGLQLFVPFLLFERTLLGNWVCGRAVISDGFILIECLILVMKIDPLGKMLAKFIKQTLIYVPVWFLNSSRRFSRLLLSAWIALFCPARMGLIQNPQKLLGFSPGVKGAGPPCMANSILRKDYYE